MAKARKTQDWLPGIDILRDALARTTQVATSITTDGIDSVFRVLGVPPSMIERGGFDWASSGAETAGERANPWRLR